MKSYIITSLFLWVLGTSFAQTVSLKTLQGRWQIVGFEMGDLYINVEDPKACFNALAERQQKEKGTALTAEDSLALDAMIISATEAAKGTYFIFNANKTYSGLNTLGETGVKELKGDFEYDEATQQLTTKPYDKGPSETMSVGMKNGLLSLGVQGAFLLFRK